MSETWYEVSKYGWRVYTVEVEKSTDMLLIIKGRRVAKHSQYTDYLPTMGEARRFLRGICENQIRYHRGELEKAEAALKELG